MDPHPKGRLYSTLSPRLLVGFLVVPLVACAEGDQAVDQEETPREAAAGFLSNLNDLCGEAFEGVVLDAPDTDPDFHPDDDMLMHVRECGPEEVRVPVWMGDDGSRTFVFTLHPQGLDVRHDHRHPDGRPESNTLYGAPTAEPPVAEEPPSATRQEFKSLTDEGVSTGWIAEITDDGRFLYGTQRNGEWRHHFEFDLTESVEPPGDPWGYPPLGEVPELVEPQDEFWDNLAGECGQAFPGEFAELPEDFDMFTGDEELVVHFRECDDTRLKVPFHVDDDRSRTWVFIRTTAGIDLRHDHRLEDGAPDPESTWYGAHTLNDGSPQRQEFLRQDSDEGESGWAVEIVPGERYTYGTIREGDWTVRVDFDLTSPIDPPPAPWGH